MKIIILSLLALITVASISCRTIFKGKKEKHGMNDSIFFEKYASKMSPPTAMLLKDIHSNTVKNENLQNFVPDSILIQKYNLKLDDGVYYVNGIVKANKELKKNFIDKHKIKVRTEAGNILTIGIPLFSLKILIMNENVTYVQIDEKLFKK
jgi:hypothetical protein